MAALNAALALAQRDHPAVGVGEHLDFDVAGALEVFFDVQLPRPERLQRLARRRLEGGLDLSCFVDEPHPFAAAPGDGLEEHRKPEPLRFALRLHMVGDRPRRARHDRHAGGLHAAARFGLVAHRADGGGGRPDERQARLRDGFGERGALGEEAVPRVNGLAVGGARRLQELRHVEIGLGGRRGTDRDGAVGGAHVGREPVCVGIHGHRLEPFLVAGPHDPQGDLTAVRDEDARELRHQMSDIRHQKGVLTSDV